MLLDPKVLIKPVNKFQTATKDPKPFSSHLILWNSDFLSLYYGTFCSNGNTYQIYVDVVWNEWLLDSLQNKTLLCIDMYIYTIGI